MLKTNEVKIRDPFVLPYDGKYYLYGTRSATTWGPADGFDCYVSENLSDWEGPIEIFKRPDGERIFTLHYPNDKLKEHPVFSTLKKQGDGFYLEMK
jgi:hypothetical protein